MYYNICIVLQTGGLEKLCLRMICCVGWLGVAGGGAGGSSTRPGVPGDGHPAGPGPWQPHRQEQPHRHRHGFHGNRYNCTGPYSLYRSLSKIKDKNNGFQYLKLRIFIYLFIKILVTNFQTKNSKGKFSQNSEVKYIQ